MPHPDRQNRSSLVEAHQWVSRLTTVGLEMSLPALFGHWLDKKWDSTPWLTAIGAVLGFILGMIHLLRMAKEAEIKERKSKDGSKTESDSSPNDHDST